MPSLSRRAALRAGGVALLAGSAGCSGRIDGGDSTSETTTASAPPSSRGAWTFELDGPVGLGPALRDGTLYVGRDDGTLVALDSASGDERWSADAGRGFFGGTGGRGAAPAVAAGRVYVVPGAQRGVAGEGFRAVALDRKSGEEEWTYSMDEMSFLTLLGVRDGRVLVASSDDYLQNEGETLAALDPASGDEQWTGEVGDPDGWAVGAGGTYVASYSGVRAVSLADGSARWSKTGHPSDDVALTNGTVVAGFDSDTGPNLAGFDPESGSVRWRASSSRRVTSYAAADGVVYASGERAAAYDAADGAERWTAQWGGALLGPPVDGRLFVHDRGFLHAFDAATGERHWGTEVSLDGALATGSSLVAYVSNSADSAVPPTLVARRAADGTPALAVTFDDANALRPPVVDGGTVYVATAAGRVAAFRP